jgi:hypothetical protein
LDEPPRGVTAPDSSGHENVKRNGAAVGVDAATVGDAGGTAVGDSAHPNRGKKLMASADIRIAQAKKIFDCMTKGYFGDT